MSVAGKCCWAGWGLASPPPRPARAAALPARTRNSERSAPTASCRRAARSTRRQRCNLPPTRRRETGTPLFLPAGIYSTSRLTLKSGTQIEGVPGRSILRYRDGGAHSQPRGRRECAAGRPRARRRRQTARRRRRAARRDRGEASRSRRVPLRQQRREWRVLRKVSGWIKDCEIGDIGKAGLFSEDAAGLRDRA